MKLFHVLKTYFCQTLVAGVSEEKNVFLPHEMFKKNQKNVCQTLPFGV